MDTQKPAGQNLKNPVDIKVQKGSNQTIRTSTPAVSTHKEEKMSATPLNGTLAHRQALKAPTNLRKA